MDLRRTLAAAKAFLAETHGEDPIAEWLAEPFDHELTGEERRRIEYRRKARELGIAGGNDALMNAFRTRPAGA